jgi:hypothetical protein
MANMSIYFYFFTKKTDACNISGIFATKVENKSNLQPVFVNIERILTPNMQILR